MSTNAPPKRNKAKAKRHPSGRPESYSTLLETGVAAEEQAERYQHGLKALRHSTSALDAYRRAAQVARSSSPPEDHFDAIYNGARVLVSLGTSFATGRVDPVARIAEGVAAYREAIALASSNPEASERTADASFNLSQALISWAEMLEGGAKPWGSETPDSLRSEAIRQLEGVIVVQQRAMEETGQAQVPGSGSTNGYEEEPSMILDTSSTASGVSGLGSGPAAESQTITPSVVLDTVAALLGAVVVLPTPFLTVFPSVAVVIETGDRLASTLPLSLARPDWTMARLSAQLTALEHELDAQAATPSERLHAPIQAILSTASATLTTPLPSGYEPFDLQVAYAEILSTAASILCRLPPSHDAQSTCQAVLRSAIEAHQAVRSRLLDRLRPVRGLQTHEVPALVSATFTAEADILLSSDPADAAGALAAGVRAYDAALGELGLSHAGEGRLAVTMRIAGDVRNDWSCLCARLEAIRVLAKAKALLGESADAVVRLVKRLGADVTDVRRWSEEDEQPIGAEIWKACLQAM